VRTWLKQNPFLTLGCFTLMLFLLVEALQRQDAVVASERLAGLMRVLIIPMYLVWLVVTIITVALAGPDGLPGLFGWLLRALQFAVGLAPYVLADYFLRRWRSSSG